MAGVKINIQNLIDELDRYVGDEFKDRMVNAMVRAV
jgi:hypothetical protein